MLQDKLMINDAKTEFIIIGSQLQLSKLTISNLTVGGCSISLSLQVCNLHVGCWFESNLTMNKQITKTCSTAFYHSHNIRRIRKYLSREALVVLVHAYITVSLDYCNSLFYGFPNSQLAKLQKVQNATARLVCGTPRWSQMPLLYQLHWLPVHYRIEFNIILLTFKALHHLAPDYIIDMLHVKDNSSYSLRSNNRLLLNYPLKKRDKIYWRQIILAGCAHIMEQLALKYSINSVSVGL